MAFLRRVQRLGRYKLIRRLGVNNIIITLVMLLAKLMDILSRFKVMRAIEKGIGFFGVISLEFYCIQGVVLHYILLDRLPKGMATPLYNLIALAGTTAMATVLYLAERGFWFLVELPFRKKKKPDPAPPSVPQEDSDVSSEAASVPEDTVVSSGEPSVPEDTVVSSETPSDT